MLSQLSYTPTCRGCQIPDLAFARFLPLTSVMVGLGGLEPPTSRLSGVRSNRLSYKPIFPAFRLFPQAFGGDKRDRTADPLLAKQVLSQLSYTPVYLGQDPEN